MQQSRMNKNSCHYIAILFTNLIVQIFDHNYIFSSLITFECECPVHNAICIDGDLLSSEKNDDSGLLTFILKVA